jgi:hypothetical protein
MGWKWDIWFGVLGARLARHRLRFRLVATQRSRQPETIVRRLLILSNEWPTPVVVYCGQGRTLAQTLCVVCRGKKAWLRVSSF